MNAKTWTRIIAVTLFAALALPVSLAAQDAAKKQHRYHHYQIVDPGTFGGPSNGLQAPFYPRFGVLNNHGTLVGNANTLASAAPYCSCNAADAFQFQDGVLTDLGRVSGGIDSQANWISGNGLIAGLGDNGVLDPLAGFPIPYLHGLLWDHGTMTDLGTLPEGGDLVFPIGVNNRAEVVGSAQNTVPDPNTMFNPGYGTQSRAFYWKDGVMQDLGTLGTGTDATAALINEHGQVVGWSYINSDPSPLCASLWSFGFLLHTDSFIWDKKNGMRDIGGLGGSCTIATDLNNRGQIVGISALTGDLVLHPFVWDAVNGMTDLPGAFAGGSAVFASTINEHGVVAGSICGPGLPGDCRSFVWRNTGGKWKKTHLGNGSVPTSINAREQVVGYGNIPFLWEDGGPWVDLSTLVPPNSGLQIYETDQINDRGEIAVQSTDASGNNHALLLIPCDENHPDVSGCDYETIDAETAAARFQQNPTQRPTALTPDTRGPGMLNRFRSPKSRPAAGHPPAHSASLALPAMPATGDWLDDRRTTPPPLGTSAFCLEAGGALTGGCVPLSGANACQITYNGCPSGAKSSGSEITCVTGRQLSVSGIKCFSLPGFDLSASALTPTTVSAGGSATSTITVAGYGSFGGTVVFTCAMNPSPMLAPTCSVSPGSVRSGTANLTVSTVAPTSALLPGAGSGLRYALWLPLFGLVATGLGFGAKRKDRKAHWIAPALVCLLLTGTAVQVGCGGGTPKPGTLPGQYTVTVTGTSGSVVSTATAMLTVQ